MYFTGPQLPTKGCELKANTLIVEGSVKVSCATECQAKCQQDDCCQVLENTVEIHYYT